VAASNRTAAHRVISILTSYQQPTMSHDNETVLQFHHRLAKEERLAWDKRDEEQSELIHELRRDNKTLQHAKEELENENRQLLMKLNRVQSRYEQSSKKTLFQTHWVTTPTSESDAACEYSRTSPTPCDTCPCTDCKPK